MFSVPSNLSADEVRALYVRHVVAESLGDLSHAAMRLDMNPETLRAELGAAESTVVRLYHRLVRTIRKGRR